MQYYSGAPTHFYSGVDSFYGRARWGREGRICKAKPLDSAERVRVGRPDNVNSTSYGGDAVVRHGAGIDHRVDTCATVDRRVAGACVESYAGEWVMAE